jgi:hypothetical protein
MARNVRATTDIKLNGDVPEIDWVPPKGTTTKQKEQHAP